MPTPSSRATTLADVGERAAIERLARLLAGDRRDVTAGIGDDCAVVRLPGRRSPDLLLTSDAVIRGVHFDSRVPPGGIGHKAVGRVLSDIAAMGGDPAWALIDLVAPARTAMTELEGIYRGAAALARRYGMSIVGGDTARADNLELHVFGVGQVPRGRARLRSAARPGHRLFVTGCLGGSIRGRHYRFPPRVKEGRFLRSWAAAMIDVSDGIARDLRHILKASRVGARIRAADIPISPDARRRNTPPRALQHALVDGEDFELLFTVAPARARAFQAAWAREFQLPCTEIGVITRDCGQIELVHPDGHGEPCLATGYEHFVT